MYVINGSGSIWNEQIPYLRLSGLLSPKNHLQYHPHMNTIKAAGIGKEAGP